MKLGQERTRVRVPLDRCGLGEWETYEDLGGGLFGVASGLD